MLSAGSQREYQEGAWHGDLAQARRVARGALAMAVWGLETGITPTADVEEAIAQVIRAHPAWHRAFLEGSPAQVASVVRQACEQWRRGSER